MFCLYHPDDLSLVTIVLLASWHYGNIFIVHNFAVLIVIPRIVFTPEMLSYYNA